MRFSVAAMTLAASGSAAASGIDHVENNAVMDEKRASSYRQQQLLLQAQAMGDSFRNHGVGLFTHGFVAKHALKNGDKKPCVPQVTSPSTFESDFLGVLSCGLREYCVENDASSLGGYCEPIQGSRSLQTGDCIYWNPIDSCVSSGLEFCDEPQAGYSCDCGGVMVDPANSLDSSGDVSCLLPSYCEADEGGETGFAPCPDTCWTVQSESTFAPNDLGNRDYEVVVCTEFSSPYIQTFCRVEISSVEEGVVQRSCRMSLDGEYCTSCSIGTFEGTPQENPDFFDSWDCTNIGLGTSPDPDLGAFASRFTVQPPLFSENADCDRTNTTATTSAPSVGGTPVSSTTAPFPPEATTPAPSPDSSAPSHSGLWMATGAAVSMWFSTAW
jgi:hypothetical protein